MSLFLADLIPNSPPFFFRGGGLAGTWAILRSNLALLHLKQEEEEEEEGVCWLAAPFTKPVTVQLGK